MTYYELEYLRSIYKYSVFINREWSDIIQWCVKNFGYCATIHLINNSPQRFKSRRWLIGDFEFNKINLYFKYRNDATLVKLTWG